MHPEHMSPHPPPLPDLQDQRRLQRIRQLDLSRALESSRRSLAAVGRRIGAPQWCSPLVKKSEEVGGQVRCQDGGGGCGHRGFLFELFKLRDGCDDSFFQALSSLLCKEGEMEGREGGGGLATCYFLCLVRFVVARKYELTDMVRP